MAVGVSCADYTWRALPHTVALTLIAELGFDAVDLGFFVRHSHLNPDEVFGDSVMWAGRVRERCESRNLRIADLFFQADGPETLAVNHPDEAERYRSRDTFRQTIEFASNIGSPVLTILPGVVFGDEDWRSAFERSAVELRERVALAGEAGLALSVEPHIGSIVDTAARTAELVEAVPGLFLTLDYSHFLVGGESRENIDALLKHARHVHCRAATPNRLQTTLEEDVIDYRRVVTMLIESGYDGYVACEYVWSDWMHLNEVNVVNETVALFELLREATGVSSN